VIFDAHEGLKQAISTVLSGSTWQRCRVHFMRNLSVPQATREAIAAIVRMRLGAILIEQDDEWAVAERRYFSAESMKLPTTEEILAAVG
jgi:transposase-like protein